MREHDAKLDYWSTTDEAVAVYRRLQTLVEPHGYGASLHGGALVNGAGHDVDLLCVPLEVDQQRLKPDELVMRIIAGMALTIVLYEQHDYDDAHSDVFVCFVTRRGRHFVDLHVRGSI